MQSSQSIQPEQSTRFNRGNPLVGHRAAITLIASILLASLLTPCIALAADPAPAAMSAKSLDEQVQEIKGDVLAIAAELSNLEEKLIYPSNTQVAIFVEMDTERDVPIDSARLSIDGELVAHHIYTFKELQALRKGGVQRLFTGNLPTGQHRVEIVVSGARGSDNGFEITESFAFDKEVDPKRVGITLGAGAVGNPTVAIGNW